MKTKLIKFFVVFSTFVVFVSIGFAILSTERNKKIYSLKLRTAKSQNVNSAWLDYQKQYNNQILELQKQNQQQMEVIKKQYEELLQKQQGLINSQAVPIQQVVTTPEQIVEQTTQQVVSTPKPQSTPVTRVS